MCLCVFYDLLFLDLIYAQSLHHLNGRDILTWLLNILNHTLKKKIRRTIVRFALISLVLYISGIDILYRTFQTNKKKFDFSFVFFI